MAQQRPVLFSKKGPLPENVHDLGDNWYASTFLDEYISIRKYIHYISPKMYPTEKGVLLNDEQWGALASNARRISSLLKRKAEETLVDLPPLTVSTSCEGEVFFRVLNRHPVILAKAQWEALVPNIARLSGFFGKKKRKTEGQQSTAKRGKAEEPVEEPPEVQTISIDDWECSQAF